jgi:phage replication O-like protein O
MASPQKENGNTPIANEIMEAIVRTYWTGYEIRVVLFVLRKTYGWHKKEDWISLSTFEKATKIKSKYISRTIIKLIKRNILIKINGKLQFNKNYDDWDYPLIRVSPNEGRGIPKRGEKVSPNQGTTKETTKETIQKIIDFYIKSFKEDYGVEPEISEKNYLLVERVLEKHTPTEIKEIIKYYKDSKKCEEYKFKLTVALSTDTINDYILWAKAT